MAALEWLGFKHRTKWGHADCNLATSSLSEFWNKKQSLQMNYLLLLSKFHDYPYKKLLWHNIWLLNLSGNMSLADPNAKRA